MKKSSISYRDWLSLFGRTTQDPQLRAKLIKAGISKTPVVPKQSTDVRVDLPGMTLVFKDASLFPNIDAGSGTGVLGAIILMLNDKVQGVYEGDLPFDLERGDSQKKLRERFGAPSKSNATFNWDEWEIDGLKLYAEYVESLDELNIVAVTMKPPA